MSKTFNNCLFHSVSVTLDKEAVETIQTIAKALLNLTELFKSQNIQIDPWGKVMPDGVDTESE